METSKLRQFRFLLAGALLALGLVLTASSAIVRADFFDSNDYGGWEPITGEGTGYVDNNGGWSDTTGWETNYNNTIYGNPDGYQLPPEVPGYEPEPAYDPSEWSEYQDSVMDAAEAEWEEQQANNDQQEQDEEQQAAEEAAYCDEHPLECDQRDYDSTLEEDAGEGEIDICEILDCEDADADGINNSNEDIVAYCMANPSDLVCQNASTWESNEDIDEDLADALAVMLGEDPAQTAFDEVMNQLANELGVDIPTGSTPPIRDDGRPNAGFENFFGDVLDRLIGGNLLPAGTQLLGADGRLNPLVAQTGAGIYRAETGGGSGGGGSGGGVALPSITPHRPPGVPDNIWGIVANLFNFAISVSSVIFVVLLLIGGLMYLGSAGEEAQVTKSKQLMLAAIIGLFIVLSAWTVSTFVLKKLNVPTNLGQPTEFVFPTKA